MWSRFLSDYGMLFVLLALCAVLSAVTWSEQYPSGAAGGEALARDVIALTPTGAKVLVVVRGSDLDQAFAEALAAALRDSGRRVVEIVRGDPADARKALERLAGSADRPEVIAATIDAGKWEVLQDVAADFPALAGARLLVPSSYSWPNFLRPVNLLNITNQIAVIAILAIGMTAVILTGGIDLSVGSLVALSAVLATSLIRDRAGAENASAAGMAACCLAAIAGCGLVGLTNGLLVTRFEAPPFIVTLGMMLIARGLAYLLSENQSIYQLPQSFTGLGQGTLISGLPIAVVLMLTLYVFAHFIMAHTTLGRYVYAVGSNVKAARYGGVPVERIIVMVYVISGLFAGLGGVIMASQLRSASPNYAKDYELQVIVAVVIGGTSLSGGEGKMFGTLIGALLIAVVHNGMNLLGVTSHAQTVVLGSVLIAAVLLDRIKRRGFGHWLARRTP
jgi:ribose transport system permease protein